MARGEKVLVFLQRTIDFPPISIPAIIKSIPFPSLATGYTRGDFFNDPTVPI
jgi:hypothetical protein